MPKFAEVAIALPMDRIFHYAIPERLSQEVAVGKRVFVPFAHRNAVGYIVGLCDTADVKDVKEIAGVIDSDPVVNEEMRALTQWMKDTYFCSWGEAIEATIPAGIKKGKREIGTRLGKKEIQEAAQERSLPHTPTKEQESALAAITGAHDRNDARVFLLYGITSSGKTEVYLQAIDHVLKKGKTAIMLVPEIALTPQTVERFVSRFGDQVAVIHSGLTQARKYLEWKRIKQGGARIVVGARSAILAPLESIGIIIIDEEHETTYKQEDVPRYHARDIAQWRAKRHGCPLVLGSATPSLESYYRATHDDYTLIKLTRRIDERMLPKVKIVDMRMELATRRQIAIFSKVLLDALEATLKRGKQAILFLNRRGFSTFMHCKKCGLVFKCKRCDTTLVYHFEEKRLMCHYCGYSVAPPDICPKCRSAYIKYFGVGTERVESEIARVAGGASIARMDSDTTSARGAHDKILGDFKTGETTLLVGTQMVAKGHDFPSVTLVGVISADASLNIPDFRASERTFNLLTQVAGRAGRGEHGGEVVVQTYTPSHYAIQTAAKHDYEKFYDQEIVSRKELHFPPFTHLVKITVRARNDEMAAKAAASLADAIKAADADVALAGPAPAPIARIRGYFRYNVVLKGEDRPAICLLLRKVLGEFRKPYGILIAVDVDPMSMM